MSLDTRLDVDTVEGLLVIRLDRPEKANAMDGRMLHAIRETLSTHGEDHHATVIHGAGRWFSGGVDLGEALPAPDPAGRPPTEPAALLHDLIHTIRHQPSPVVALVDGACVGGAVELVSACDLRIGTPAATFRVPATEIGVVYRVEGMVALRRAVGAAGAKQLLLTGLPWDADAALSHGLLDKVVEAGSAWEHIRDLCRQLTAVPHTFARQKHALRQLDDADAPSEAVRAATAAIRDEHIRERDGGPRSPKGGR